MKLTIIIITEFKVMKFRRNVRECKNNNVGLTMRNAKTIWFIALFASLAFVFSSCGGGGGGTATSPADTTIGDEVALTGAADTPDLSDAPEAASAIEAMKQGQSFAGDDLTEAALQAELDSDAVTESVTPPPLGASGGPSVNTYYVPSKAFDGTYNTWWAGQVNAKTWELIYGFQNVQNLERLHFNFYSEDYLPNQIWIYTSTDGLHWTRRAKVQWKKYTADVDLNVELKYVRLYMRGNPKSGFPLVRDITWFPQVERIGSYAEPSAREDYYFPTNMFDNRSNTWWAGERNAGAWTIYYFMTAPKLLGSMIMDIYNVDYRPLKMTLFISDDGLSWEEIGTFANNVWPPALFIGRTTRGIKLEMTGTPPSTFPLIRDINFAFQPGPNAAPNADNVFWKASNAFDANPSTWWVGTQNAGSWNVFYGFEQPTSVGTVTVNMYSVNHRPQSVKLLKSDDGETWTTVGLFPAGATPSLAVNAATKFLRISMEGDPPVGYPIIRDIAW